jgi:gamma-glutamyltranspeptidase/glutathione hydrolase/leukotriene-C4 hydrolase
MSPPIPRSRSENPIATESPKDRPRRSISFAEGLHPDADRPCSWDAERTPLLGPDGKPRQRERLTALIRRTGKATFPLKGSSEDDASSRGRTFLGGIFCGLIVALVISSAAFIQPVRPGSIIHPPIIPIRHPSYLIHAKHGAVASENESCSIIGVEMLKQGGSAVDAAIAATLCIGVLNMFSSGIGGGGFMVIKPPNDKAYTIDFRETAPSASNATMFLKDPLSSIWGGLAVGVPGEIRGLAEAHRRWGKLPWRDIFEPSVKLATRFRVTKMLAERLQVSRGSKYSFVDLMALQAAGMFMVNDPDWAPIFAPDGALAREGDYISREVYSKTLEAIARDGPDAFYYVSVSLLSPFGTTFTPPFRDPLPNPSSPRYKQPVVS